jgi:aryl-alcohol dehydrogenase-like predicted oxidoreductase
MEKRRLGRTGHLSTVITFGAVALARVSQAEADRAMELVLEYGVNHIDVAPSYGEAEVRLGPWMPQIRSQVFLGCKTQQRTREGAWAELHRSLERLRVDSFDLYQLHAVGTLEELDKCTAPGGALEAIIQAREQGLVRWIGITGHGHQAPATHLEALRRFDFDTVMFPLNFVLYSDPAYRAAADQLLRVAREKDVGVQIIKTVARGPWGTEPKTHDTWYAPFTDPEKIDRAVAFVLSLPVTTLTTPGDLRLLPHVLAAGARFRPLSQEEMAALLAEARQYQSPFAA